MLKTVEEAAPYKNGQMLKTVESTSFDMDKAVSVHRQIVNAAASWRCASLQLVRIGLTATRQMKYQKMSNNNSKKKQEETRSG